MLIETHAHLDYSDFQADFADVLQRANDAGVTRIITIGTSIASSRRAVELAETHPSIYAVIGVHPTTDDTATEDVMTPLRELAQSKRVVAIGETGLDYHRLPSLAVAKEKQVQVFGRALQSETEEEMEAGIHDGALQSAAGESFEQQLDLAVELGLNVVIHQRDAWDDTLAMVAPYAGKLRGVFHCFGGTLEQAEEVLALDHLVSFTGIVDFQEWRGVRAVSAQLPLWKLHGGNGLPVSGAGAASREALRTGLHAAGGGIDRGSARHSAVGTGGSDDGNGGEVFSVQSLMKFKTHHALRGAFAISVIVLASSVREPGHAASHGDQRAGTAAGGVG